MIVTADSAPSIRHRGPGWREEWLLGIAERIGDAADCRRRRVGAVIASRSSFHIYGGGYNGLVAKGGGCETTGACPRGQLTHEQLPGIVTPYRTGPGRCPAAHAEENAVARADEAGHDLTGTVIVITDEPCQSCRDLIEGRGIAVAVWPGGRWTQGEQWPPLASVSDTVTTPEETP